jgi:putative ABC transport system permease protein
VFRNYLPAAHRNLARNRLYAGINIIGLAVGFAAAILIGLFIRDEFTYDAFIPDHQHVYRVSTIRLVLGRSPIFVPVVTPEFATWMKLDFRGVQSVARLASEQVGAAPRQCRETFTGPYRFAQVLERIAAGIQSGDIPLPK